MPIINIPGHGTHPLSINGLLRQIPRGVDTPVSKDELASLRESHLDFATIDEEKGNAPTVKNDIGKRPVVTASTETQTPGGDSLAQFETPAEGTVTIPPADIHQEPGGDSLERPDESDAVEREVNARKEAADAADAADAGETEPVEVLTNADPNQDGAGVDADDAFDANAVLNGSVADITAQLESFTPAQRKALIKAEKKGKARTTLLSALEAE